VPRSELLIITGNFLREFFRFFQHQVLYKLVSGRIDTFIEKSVCFCRRWRSRTFLFALKDIRMEGLVFMQEVGHVFDFIFLQLTALHLAHIELNSICACRLTH
jgi:hypothetical protein